LNLPKIKSMIKTFQESLFQTMSWICSGSLNWLKTPNEEIRIAKTTTQDSGILVLHGNLFNSRPEFNDSNRRRHNSRHAVWGLFSVHLIWWRIGGRDYKSPSLIITRTQAPIVSLLKRRSRKFGQSPWSIKVLLRKIHLCSEVFLIS